MSLAVFFSIVLLSGVASAQDPVAKQPDKKRKVIAALISVGSETDSKKFEGDNIDLVEVNGKPLIWWAYQGLKNCADVDEIYVVGSPESIRATGAKFEKGDLHFIESEEEAVKKLMRVVDLADENDIIINVPSDLPLLTPDDISALVDHVGKNPGGDYYLFMIRSEIYEKKYPEKKRVNFKFAEGELTAAHIQILIPRFFKRNKKQAVQFYRMRRKPLGMMKLLGGKLFGRYMRGKLSLRDIEQRTKEKVCCVMKISIIDEPDYATDLQRPKQKELIERVLKAKAKKILADQRKKQDDNTATAKPAGNSGGSQLR